MTSLTENALILQREIGRSSLSEREGVNNEHTSFFVALKMICEDLLDKKINLRVCHRCNIYIQKMAGMQTLCRHFKADCNYLFI